VHAELNKDGEERPFFVPARDRALVETAAVLASFERAVQAKFSAVGPNEAADRLLLLKDASAASEARRARCRVRPPRAEAPRLPRILETPLP
jgi:hypothetical protein